MATLLRIVAAYIGLIGIAIVVHFLITPFYDPGAYARYTAWEVMHWFMAPAMLLTLIVSYANKRRTDKDEDADLKPYLEANSVFYGSVAASIIYFWNWFNNLSPNSVADGQFWSILGAAMPILMVVAGLRLWRRATV